MFFRRLNTTATENTDKSKGRITNQDSSGTVGDEVGSGYTLDEGRGLGVGVERGFCVGVAVGEEVCEGLGGRVGVGVGSGD